MLPKDSKRETLSTNYALMNTNNSIPAARIKVVGVGGGGGNAVRRMIESELDGVEFWAMNTDIQVLNHTHGANVLQLGASITRGLGAGMSPEVGRQAAEESEGEIESALKDSDMLFITAGMGGGTGTGAGPVVAEVAKRLGILTVAVVTRPFFFEGNKRMQVADEGIERLKANADAVIVVPNERLLQYADKRTSLGEAFRISDDILRQAVQGISDLINFPGEINVDFADVRAIMSNAGTALMGIGKASGVSESKALEAAKSATESPLLEMDIRGAKGVLLNVQGGKNLPLADVSEASMYIRNQADPDAKIIFGTTINPNLNDEILITVIATGFSKDKESQVKRENKVGFSMGSALNQDNKDTYTPPKFKQSSGTEQKSSSTTTSIKTKSDEDEKIQVPAFIRNKMNLDK